MNASKVESGKEHCLRGMTVVNFLFVVGGKKKKKSPGEKKQYLADHIQSLLVQF